MLLRYHNTQCFFRDNFIINQQILLQYQLRVKRFILFHGSLLSGFWGIYQLLCLYLTFKKTGKNQENNKVVF